MLSRGKVEKDLMATYRTIAWVMRHPLISIFVYYVIFTWGLWYIVKIWEVPINPRLDTFLDHLYFQIVIQSTVGLGDIVFVSRVGQLVVLPATIFMALTSLMPLVLRVNEAIKIIKIFYQRMIMSLKKKHRIIIGSSRGRARQMAETFLGHHDEVEDVVICSVKEVTNLPKGAEWIEFAADDLEECLRNINLSKASSLSVDMKDDNIAIRICLQAQMFNSELPIVVTLEDETSEKTIKQVNHLIECIVPTPIDVVAKAATVPGRYAHIRDSSSEGGEVDSINVTMPKNFIDIEKKYLAIHLLRLFNVNILYVIRAGKQTSHPKLDFVIKAGDVLGIETESDFNLKSINWNKITIN